MSTMGQVNLFCNRKNVNWSNHKHGPIMQDCNTFKAIKKVKYVRSDQCLSFCFPLTRIISYDRVSSFFFNTLLLLTRWCVKQDINKNTRTRTKYELWKEKLPGKESRSLNHRMFDFAQPIFDRPHVQSVRTIERQFRCNWTVKLVRRCRGDL